MTLYNLSVNFVGGWWISPGQRILRKVRWMKPAFVRYARFFCAGAIAASVLLEQFGMVGGLANLGASSVAGVGVLLVAKKFAFVI